MFQSLLVARTRAAFKHVQAVQMRTLHRGPHKMFVKLNTFQHKTLYTVYISKFGFQYHDENTP